MIREVKFSLLFCEYLMRSEIYVYDLLSLKIFKNYFTAYWRWSTKYLLSKRTSIAPLVQFAGVMALAYYFLQYRSHGMLNFCLPQFQFQISRCPQSLLFLTVILNYITFSVFVVFNRYSELQKQILFCKFKTITERSIGN